MVNTNKIYKILKSITMVIFIFYAIRSCSYAWSTTKQDLLDKLEVLGQQGVIGEYVFENIELNSYFTDNYTKYAIIVGAGTRGNLGRYRRLYIYMGNGTEIKNDTNDPDSTLYLDWAYSNGQYCCYDVDTGHSLSAGMYKLNDLQEPFYVYTTIPINTRVLTLGSGEEHGGHYFTTPFSFDLASTLSISNYQGLGQFFAFRYTYNNNKWLLGTCSGLEDVTEVVFKMIDLTSDSVIATCYKTGSASNMRLVGNDLQIDGYILYQNQPYRLNYDVYVDGEIVESDFYDVVFMDRFAVINNGVVDSYGSGDSYNVQNSTNELMDNSQVGAILQGFGSGDMSTKLGFQEYNNPFQDIIFGFAYNLATTLNSSGDVYFDYSMHGESPTRIYASYFTTPETALKQFIRISMVFGVMFVVYNQFREIIEAISTARAPEILHDIDADVYFYKM